MKGKVILVAVDASAAAQQAVKVALELASGLDSPLRLVHADSHLARELFAEHPDEGPTRQEIAAADAVLAAAAALADAAAIHADLELIAEDSGADLAAALAGIANGIDAGLIVVGSRGHGALAGTVLGSVSHNLIRYATRPVVVVHGGA